jgi:hypothetical protein
LNFEYDTTFFFLVKPSNLAFVFLELLTSTVSKDGLLGDKILSMEFSGLRLLLILYWVLNSEIEVFLNEV